MQSDLVQVYKSYTFRENSRKVIKVFVVFMWLESDESAKSDIGKKYYIYQNSGQ